MEAVDTVRTVETPEGVELHLRPAGPVVRSLALLADQVVIWVGLLLGLLGLAFLGPLGMGLWLMLVFVSQWLYPVFFEVLGEGRTLGKRWFKLRVLMEDGRPVGWAPSLIRNLLRFVDALPGAYTLGLASVMLTRNFQRLGDLVAGTVVVHEEDPLHAPRLPEGQPEAPPQPLSLEEQSALVAFAERSVRLTPARAEELSDLLRPLTGTPGPEGLRRVLAYARHAWGGR